MSNSGHFEMTNVIDFNSNYFIKLSIEIFWDLISLSRQQAGLRHIQDKYGNVVSDLRQLKAQNDIAELARDTPIGTSFNNKSIVWN